FDGSGERPWVESDAPAPLNVYGASKAAAERDVLARCPAAMVVRTSAFFGPWDEYNFVTVLLRALAEGVEFAAADDVVVSPTYVPDLTHACLDLLTDGEGGVWHLSNAGALTWADFARLAAERAGLESSLVRGCPSASLGLAAPRPAFSALDSERGALLPPLEDALARYFNECELWAPSRRRVEVRTG
ncbi:MAG TPA: sugar nucleotide-binding protein, partial [Pyrinomonadaceae bacterium]